MISVALPNLTKFILNIKYIDITIFLCNFIKFCIITIRIAYGGKFRVYPKPNDI